MISFFRASSARCTFRLPSRDILSHRPLIPHNAIEQPSAIQVRLFSPTTSLTKHTPKPVPHLKGNIPPSRPAKSRQPRTAHASDDGQRTTYRSFEATLARQSEELLLYKAPSHQVYFIGCYAFGFFCLTYAGYNFYNHYLHPPEGLATWVPIAYGGVCFFMVCFGTWLCLGTSRIISRIVAIPDARSVPPKLNIRIYTRPMLALPFRQRRPSCDVAPSSITLSSRLQLYGQHPVESEIQSQYQQSRLTQVTKALTAPFRALGSFTWELLSMLSRVWTRDGFIKVQVKGKHGVFKLDETGGWAFDQGRGLNRLIRVKPL